jgi:hypothetical protein
MPPSAEPSRAHLGRLLAVAPDGSAVAVAAWQDRLAVLSVTQQEKSGSRIRNEEADNSPLASSVPASDMPSTSTTHTICTEVAGTSSRASSMHCQAGLMVGTPVVYTEQAELEVAGAQSLEASCMGLGTIWDLAFLAVSVKDTGLRLAALTYR